MTDETVYSNETMSFKVIRMIFLYTYTNTYERNKAYILDLHSGSWYSLPTSGEQQDAEFGEETTTADK